MELWLFTILNVKWKEMIFSLSWEDYAKNSFAPLMPLIINFCIISLNNHNSLLTKSFSLSIHLFIFMHNFFLLFLPLFHSYEFCLSLNNWILLIFYFNFQLFYVEMFGSSAWHPHVHIDMTLFYRIRKLNILLEGSSYMWNER